MVNIVAFLNVEIVVLGIEQPVSSLWYSKEKR